MIHREHNDGALTIFTDDGNALDVKTDTRAITGSWWAFSRRDVDGMMQHIDTRYDLI